MGDAEDMMGWQAEAMAIEEEAKTLAQRRSLCSRCHPLAPADPDCHICGWPRDKGPACHVCGAEMVPYAGGHCCPECGESSHPCQ